MTGVDITKYSLAMFDIGKSHLKRLQYLKGGSHITTSKVLGLKSKLNKSAVISGLTDGSISTLVPILDLPHGKFKIVLSLNFFNNKKSISLFHDQFTW